MKISHVGLGITEQEWEVFVKHTEAVLDKFQVPEPERSEFLAAAGSVKDDIVESG